MNPKKILDTVVSYFDSVDADLGDLKTITEKQKKINEILEVNPLFADAVA